MPSLDSLQLSAAVEREALNQGVDPVLARSIFQTENFGKQRVDPQTISPAGAFGVMQVMPPTYKSLVQQGYLSPTTDPTSVEGQIRAGVAALKERMNAGITKPVELAISYNGSPQVLETYRKTGVLPAETTEYIKRFSSIYSPGATVGTDLFSPNGGSGSSSPLTSSRQSTTTVNRNIPEDFKQGMLDASSNYSDFADTAKAQISGLSASLLKSGGAAKTAAEEEGKAKVELTGANSAIDLAKVANSNNILNAFGINLNEGDNRIQENMKIIARTQAERTQLADKIATMQSASPLSDPVGWLTNLIPQSVAISRHNALVRQENGALQNISELQDMAAKQSQLQPAVVEQALQQKQLAEAHVAKAEADAKIAGIENTTTMQLAHNLIEMSNIQSQDINQRTSIARVLFERQTQNLMIGEHDKAVQAEQDKLLPVNTMVASLGLSPFTPTTFKGLPKDTQERLVEAGQFNRWGKTPAEAITTLHTILGDSGFAQLAQKKPVQGEFLRSTIEGGQRALTSAMAESATNPALQHELSKLGPEDRLQYGIAKWSADQKALLKKNDYSTLPTDSPYRLNFNYAANLTQLKDNSIAKFVREYAPQGVAQANIVMDDKTILQKAVADATLNPNSTKKIAADLRAFYEVGYLQQNMDRGMTSLGYEVPRNYPVWAKANTASALPVQMMNTADIERWLTMQVAAGAANDALRNGYLYGQDPAKLRANIPGIGNQQPAQRQ